MLPDAREDVLHLHIGGLHECVEPVQPSPHLCQFRLDSFQLLALLFGHAVHLLVYQPHQVPDVALGEDIGANLIDDERLKALGVEPGGIAGPAAPLHQRLADVVGELAALGVLAGERSVAPLALDQPAEQIGATDPAGMDSLRRTGPHELVHPPELRLGDDGGESLLHPHRLGLVLGLGSPDQSAGVGLVSEDDMHAVLGPEPARGVGDALVVEGPGDVRDPLPRLGHSEDSLHHGSGCGVGFQGGTLLGPVLHHELVVAVGHPAGHPEAPGRGLPHPTCNLLGKDIGYPIDTKHCGIRGPSIWMQRAGTVASATAGIRPEAPPTTAARVPRF